MPKRRVKVTYTAQFRTVIDLEETDVLDDAISDIEPGSGEYVEDSFEVVKTKPLPLAAATG